MESVDDLFLVKFKKKFGEADTWFTFCVAVSNIQASISVFFFF